VRALVAHLYGEPLASRAFDHASSGGHGSDGSDGSDGSQNDELSDPSRNEK